MVSSLAHIVPVAAWTAAGLSGAQAQQNEAVPVPRPFATVLNCEGNADYEEFRGIIASHGWSSPETFQWAWRRYHSKDYVPEAPTISMNPVEETFSWRTEITVAEGADVYLRRAVKLLGRILNATTAHADPLQPGDCPYGFLAVQYALLVGMQMLGKSDLREQVALALVATMQVVLDSPYHTFDFMESSVWKFSSYDVAVNLARDVFIESFDAYARENRLEAPLLPPWHAETGALLPGSLGRGGSRARLEVVRKNGSPLRVALLQLHDGTAAEIWTSIQMAFGLIMGVQSPPASLPLELLPELYFTQVKALRGTATGEMLQKHVAVPFQSLMDLKRMAEEGSITFEQMVEQWFPQVAAGAKDAHLIVCSEPHWLCPLVSRLAPDRQLAAVLHMSLLNEFPFPEETSLTEFWKMFLTMVAEQKAFAATACRFTGEQVFAQAGVRVPYVPFLGWHVGAHYTAPLARRILLFRNNRHPMLTFRTALRLYLLEFCGQRELPFEIVDMNDMKRAMSFQEMAGFQAVIMLPHGPNALRLSDVYAAAIPTIIPGEPMVHRFVWMSRTFGGYDAEPHYRAVAPEHLRQQLNRSAAGQRSVVPQGHPQFSPLHFFLSWGPQHGIDEKRYWYQYTEWATLPHLQTFKSIPDLLALLADLTPENALDISRRMKQHHALMTSDALGWWQDTISSLLQGSE